MKSYLEVAEEVFQKGDAYLEEKKKRNEAIKSGFALAAVTTVVLFSAFGITKGLLPQKAPVAQPTSFNTTETATTALSGVTISTTEPDSTHTGSQNAAPGMRTTNPRESAAATTRAANGGTVSQTPSSPRLPGSETTSQPDTKASSDTSETVQTTDDTDLTTQPAEPSEASVSDPTRSSVSTTEQSTRRLSPGASSYNAEGMLRAALEDNAFAWIKYNDHYYIHDRWTSANGMEIGEKLGEADDFEGNLELLDLSGEVFRLENGEDDSCLMLKTSDGQNMVFVLNPAGD